MRSLNQFICFLLILTLSATTHAQEKGEIVLKTGFDKRKELRKWDGAWFRLIGKKGAKELRLKGRTADENTLIQYYLPIDKVRGTKLAVKASVKGDNVSKPLNSWNGVKLMIHAKGAFGDIYPQASIPYGTFDWTATNFSTYIPADADTAKLVLGLEESSGKVYFDNLEIKVIEGRRKVPALTSHVKYKGHNLERLRGMMVMTDISEEDLRELGSWGANHIRFQLTWGGFPYSPADTVDMPVYMNWLDNRLNHLDRLLPLCKELGMNVTIDLHTMPGGRDRTSWEARAFKHAEWQQAFVDVWKHISTRYKDNPVIWGYDLANEPHEGNVPEGLKTWQELTEVTSQAIRQIDQQHAIIIEAAPGGNPISLAQFQPVKASGVVYSFHMYEPAQFTHQGIDKDVEGISYPGEIDKVYWNKEQLEKFLQPVIQWQKDYNAHIYVGEFSAIRWAPDSSAYNYLKDCIEIFEANDWDWNYHAFREWEGWSVEYDNNKQNTQPSPTPTPRQQLMMEWFSKNEHP